MKKMALSILATIIFCVSCAEENRSNNRRYIVREGQDANGQQLASRTTSEILNIKYDQAILTCNLWSQKAAEINLEEEPNDTVSLDLKTNLVFPQNLKLNAMVENHQVSVTLSIYGIDHYRILNHTDAQGNVYFAQFSPYVKMNYAHTIETTWESGNQSRDSRTAFKNVHEKIREIILTQTISSDQSETTTISEEAISYSDFIDCNFATDLRLGYEDLFVVTPANP